MPALRETPKFQISHLLWLMTIVAVSAAIASIDTQLLFIIFTLWITTTTALICQGSLKMGLGQTSIACVLVLDLCGASLISFSSWVVQSNPNTYPNSISLGDPLTAFVIGFLAFTPIASVLSLISTGIGLLILKAFRNAITTKSS